MSTLQCSYMKTRSNSSSLVKSSVDPPSAFLDDLMRAISSLSKMQDEIFAQYKSLGESQSTQFDEINGRLFILVSQINDLKKEYATLHSDLLSLKDGVLTLEIHAQISCYVNTPDQTWSSWCRAACYSFLQRDGAGYYFWKKYSEKKKENI